MPAFVPAAARAFAILEVFAKERRELSNSDVARLMDLPESSCSDLLHTMHELGYLVRTARTRRFYPSGRMLTIAKEIAASDPLFEIGLEACELLREMTGEAGLCGRVQEGVVKVLASTESRYPLNYKQRVGDKLSLHVSAMGKAVLALGSPEEAARQLRLKPLKKLGSGTIMDLRALETQIEQARQQGWIWTENEGGDGLAALAVAGFVGQEVLAICIAGPTDRLRLRRDAYLDALQKVQELVFRPKEASNAIPGSGRRRNAESSLKNKALASSA